MGTLWNRLRDLIIQIAKLFSNIKVIWFGSLNHFPNVHGVYLKSKLYLNSIWIILTSINSKKYGSGSQTLLHYYSSTLGPKHSLTSKNTPWMRCTIIITSRFKAIVHINVHALMQWFLNLLAVFIFNLYFLPDFKVLFSINWAKSWSI